MKTPETTFELQGDGTRSESFCFPLSINGQISGGKVQFKVAAASKAKERRRVFMLFLNHATVPISSLPNLGGQLSSTVSKSLVVSLVSPATLRECLCKKMRFTLFVQELGNVGRCSPVFDFAIKLRIACSILFALNSVAGF